ncbi:hydroxymethylbilane synthase [Lactococcus nasutitermitis]|uniref:Hydroxymethylbilane synthase n=1 Tax=Lactococcus nasutitermitis TaxID=1652957 RepID=A0ABV9JCV6_9LACT|nr:hydroxymethylbilane synthase [Lactococcus nasutitermitis]
MRKLRVGTRKSPLAMRQTELVIEQLLRGNPDLEIEVVGLSTQGDRDQKSDLSVIGGKGIFVTEVEKSLLSGEIDFAVHSLKDMPALLPLNLTLAAFPKRANPLDCIVYEGENPLNKSGLIRLGTSSVRREKQLKNLLSNVTIAPIRGKIETRLEKLKGEQLDGIVLACAGLERMGYEANLTLEVLTAEQCVPACAQGILGLECREDDLKMLSLLRSLNDEETAEAAQAERKFLALMNGNCDIPLGALAQKSGDSWIFHAFLAKSQEDVGRKIALEGANPSVLAEEAFEQLK